MTATLQGDLIVSAKRLGYSQAVVHLLRWMQAHRQVSSALEYRAVLIDELEQMQQEGPQA